MSQEILNQVYNNGLAIANSILEHTLSLDCSFDEKYTSILANENFNKFNKHFPSIVSMIIYESKVDSQKFKELLELMNELKAKELSMTPHQKRDLYEEGIHMGKLLLNDVINRCNNDNEYNQLTQIEQFNYMIKYYKDFANAFPSIFSQIIYEKHLDINYFKDKIDALFKTTSSKPSKSNGCMLDDKQLDTMYRDGLKIGLEILKFVQDKNKNDLEFKNLNNMDKLKYINDIDKYKTFCQIYPVVISYIVSDEVFNAKCFKKFIQVLYKTKTKEDEEFIRKDPKNIYYYKNKQYAMYSKFLLYEFNSGVSDRVVNEKYKEMVAELDKATTKNIDLYETQLSKIEQKDEELTNEKRNDLIKFFRK